eukprot:m.30701 g.30701  ORF g.30701 m.30701 type:complete len:228 (-) comp4806_c1_seq1:235-918(-)
MIRTENGKTLAAFRAWYVALTFHGRYTLLRALLESCPHGTAIHLLVLWLKEEILKADQPASTSYFRGKPMFELLAVLFAFDGGDPLHSFDRHMAVLNFCRFLLLFGSGSPARVVENNALGMWNSALLDEIQQRLIGPLQAACTRAAAAASADRTTLTGVSSADPCAMEPSPVVQEQGDGTVIVPINPDGNHRHGGETAHMQRQMNLWLLQGAVADLAETVRAGREHM